MKKKEEIDKRFDELERRLEYDTDEEELCEMYAEFGKICRIKMKDKRLSWKERSAWRGDFIWNKIAKFRFLAGLELIRFGAWLFLGKR